MHFGVDSLTSIDSVLIVWPNQQYQLLRSVQGNRQIVISQKDASGVFNYDSFFPKHTTDFED